MYIYRIVCRRETAEQADEQKDAFGLLMSAFRMNGQILDREFVSVSLEKQLDEYVSVPARDAFKSKYNNEWVRTRLEEVGVAGLSEPVFTELGRAPYESTACSCKDSNSFLLFTTYIQIQSQVRCGDCFHPVPLYRLPRHENDEFNDVIWWSSNYKSCDSLFMHSGTGERFGYREMSRIDSSLTRDGRKICTKIEQGTGKPTYYYLHRYYGRSLAVEEARKCPGCGGEWRLPERWHNLFDFKCDSCRLLSCLSLALT
jgi:predicted  nucleic acid-binding Zn ribbon protein